MSEADKMHEWKPIETAPKREVIDIWMYHPDYQGGYRETNAWYDSSRSEFMSSNDTPLCSMLDLKTRKWRIYPTHWMPLPEPPK